MARAKLLPIVLLLAARGSWVGCAPGPDEGAASAASASAADARLQRATTLDDYHPWTPYTDAAAWRERARRVREQILVAAGLWPLPPAEPLEAVIHGAVDRGDYTVEKVFFQSYPGFYVTGNLYRPKSAPPPSGKRPAVLSPHGHWQNGRFFERDEAAAKKEIAGGGEKTMEGARYPLQARCAMLARLGCVVFHYDMVGYADSKQIGHTQGFRDAEAELRMQSALGLQTYDSIRALDFLSGLPDVDPARIAVTGASGGGTQTFILCGIDDRPAVAFPAVMVSTAMQGGCVCENATLLRVNTGNIEIAALMAPRPLGMTGANDWTIDIERKGLPELKVLYTALGVPDLVDAKCFPNFDHNYNQVSRERMYTWVNRHLKLGHPEPVEEKPFEPIPPKELSVFDAAHPLPSKAVDSGRLRRWMSDASDRQIAELAPKDAATLAAYRAVIGGALRAIVNSELPDAAHLDVRATKAGAEGTSGTSEEWLIIRKGSGDTVPATWAEPKSWKGQVVVWVEGSDAAPADSRFAAVREEAARRGAAFLTPRVYLSAKTDAHFPIDAGRHKDYCGFTYGYNRTPLANRVHDVLSAVGAARAHPGTHTVHLVGVGEAGLWVLLAKGLAGDAVARVIAERPAFDFSDVKDVNDLRFLPGGVKYGGWGGFAALSAPGELWLGGEGEPPPALRAAYHAAGAEGRLRLGWKDQSAEAIAAGLLQ
jgi:dienelactone hydrolase